MPRYYGTATAYAVAHAAFTQELELSTSAPGTGSSSEEVRKNSSEDTHLWTGPLAGTGFTTYADSAEQSLDLSAFPSGLALTTGLTPEDTDTSIVTDGGASDVDAVQMGSWSSTTGTGIKTRSYASGSFDAGTFATSDEVAWGISVTNSDTKNNLTVTVDFSSNDTWVEIVPTVLGSFTADAVIEATQAGSFTADAWFATATQAGSFTADAIVKASQTGSLTSDAVIVSAYHGDTLTNTDLLAYWRLGDSGATAVDETGSYDITYGASVVTGEPSLLQSDDDDSVALHDGVTAVGAAASGLNPWGGSFTIECWAYTDAGPPPALGSNPHGIVDEASWLAVASQESYLVSGFRFGRRDASNGWAFWNNQSAPSGTVELKTNEWPVPLVPYHLVITYNGTNTFRLYVDGVEVASVTDDASYVAPAGGLTVGGVGGGDWKGGLDEVAVYDDEKTASWVSDRWVLAGPVKGFTANAYILAAFTVDAVISAGGTTETGSLTADATIKASQTGSLTADAIIQKPQSGSFDVDALIQKSQTGSLTADATVQKTQTGSATADAVIGVTQAASFTAGAFIQPFFTVDAVIAAGATTETGGFTVDATIKASQTGSLSADATIKASQTGSLAADAVISATQAGSLTASAIIRAQQAETFTADAVIAATQAGSFVADAIVFATQTGAFTLQAIKYDDVPGADGAFSIDVVILAAVSGSFTADAIAQRPQAGSVDIDAVVLKTASESFTAAGWLAGIFTIDAFIGAEATVQTFTADAIVSATQTGSFTAAAIVAAQQTGSVTVDAVVLRVESHQLNADAVVQLEQTGVVALDAVVLQSIAQSLAVDATLLDTTSGSFATDAVFLATEPASFTAAAVVGKTQVETFTLAAIAEAGVGATFSTDAVVSREASDSLAVDAVVLDAQVGSFAADAVITLVGQCTWVSPADTVQMSSTPTLVFDMPDAAASNMHFQIEIDEDSGFGSPIVYQSPGTGWEYWDGGTWQPIPASGVPAAYVGNEARYAIQTPLANGTWYRRVRAGVI